MGIFGDWAHIYSKSGLSVIPLKGKKPFFKDWSKYGKELPTDEEIDAWVISFSDYNIGVCCGISSNIIAFDFDFEGTNYNQLSEAIKEIIPSPCIKFGIKGWTGFYRYNGISNQKIRHPKDKSSICEILSTGNQTVLPPSIHPDSKNPYIWTGEYPLNEFKLDYLPEITEENLKEIKQLINNFFKFDNGAFNSTGRHNRLLNYVFAVAEKRNNIDEFVKELISKDKSWHAGREYFSDKKEFNNTDEFFNANAMVVSGIKTLKEKKISKGESWEFGSEQNKETCFYNISQIVDEKTGEISVRAIPDYQKMATHFKTSGTLACSGSGDYIYEDGHWKYTEDLKINYIITQENKLWIKPAHIDNFKKMIRSYCFAEGMNFKSLDKKVNLKNGILEVDTGKLIDHSKEYFFKYKMDIEYLPTAKCERWFEFLNFIFQNNQETILAAQKIFGYCMIGGDPFLHRAFVLYGEGRNGKSTFIDVLRNILGPASISAVSMADINKPFSVVRMDGKLANIVEETPNDTINSEIFKTITAGGIVTAARKGVDEYDLRAQCRLIFACNEMPQFKDKNESMNDRLLMIPFDVYIPEEDRDTGIKDKLFAESSGILNWAIEGARLVLADRKIDAPSVSKLLKEQYRSETDTVYGWINQNISFDNPTLVTSKKIYALYCYDITEAGQYPLSREKFFRRFKKICAEKTQGKVDKNKLESGRIRDSNGSQFRGYDFFRYNGTADQNKDFNAPN